MFLLLKRVIPISLLIVLMVGCSAARHEGQLAIPLEQITPPESVTTVRLVDYAVDSPFTKVVHVVPLPDGQFLALSAKDPNGGCAPDVQLVIPVSEYTPGTVRLERGVWIARQPGGEFYVFLDRDPHRGQPLNWVESKRLFMQAASYGLDGMCHEGPCDPSPGQGLYRVESRPEGQNLIIYPQKVISGGLHPEPAWMTDVKHFLSHLVTPQHSAGKGATPRAPG